MTQPPETHYATTPDGVYLAYQVFGEGRVDVVFNFNTGEGNVDLMWEDPIWLPFLVGFAGFARVITHDRRGTGVSSRNVPPPNLETQVADLVCVLDAVGSERPVLAGGSEGGALAALFAATHPDRISGILWNNPVGRMAWAPDYPWGLGPDEFERTQQVTASWGTSAYVRAWWTDEDFDRRTEDVATYAKINRNTATPDVALEIERVFWKTDIRAILPSVHVRAALVTGTENDVEETKYVASLMPNAAVHILEGRSGGASEPIAAIVREMTGVAPPVPGADTVLSTVLFTDIVGSTEKQAELGDRAWKESCSHITLRSATRSRAGVGWRTTRPVTVLRHVRRTRSSDPVRAGDGG